MNSVYRALLPCLLIGIADMTAAARKAPTSHENLHTQHAPHPEAHAAPAKPVDSPAVAPAAAPAPKSSYKYEVCSCVGGNGFTQTSWSPNAECFAIQAADPNVVLSFVSIDGDSLHWGYYSSPPYNACIQRFNATTKPSLQPQLAAMSACATFHNSNWLESSNNTNCIIVNSADGWGPWGYQAPLTTYTEEELQATYEQYTQTAAKAYGGGSIALSSVVDKTTIPQPAAPAPPAQSSLVASAVAANTDTSGGPYSYELCSCNTAPYGQPGDNTCGELASGTAAGSYGTSYRAVDIQLTGVNFYGKSGTPDFTLVWTQGNDMLGYGPWKVCVRRFNDGSEYNGQPSLEQLWSALPSACSPSCNTYTKTAGPDPWSCPRGPNGQYLVPSLSGCTQYPGL